MESDTNSATSAPASTSDFPVKKTMPAKSSEVSKPSNLKTFLLTHQDRSTLNTVWAQTLQPHVPLSENTYNSELGLVSEASICNNKDLKKCDIPVNIQPETDRNGTNTDNSLSEAINSTFSNLLNKFLFKMPNDLNKFVDDSVTLDTDCNFTSQSQKNVNKIYVSQKTNKTIVGKDAATEESKEYDNHDATDGSVCRVCDINCGSLELLQDHLKRTRFICRVCIEEFSNHKELESHFFAHKKYSCRVCKEKFSDRKRLLKHRRTSDSCSYRHQCDSCGKQMANKNSLRKHKLAFHSDSREAIVCIICRKDFTSPVLLNSHLQSCHTVYEQVECNTCQKLFLGPERLKIHIRAAHLDFDEHYGCACSTCDKRFSNIHNLKKHLKTHDAAGFLCKICGELFKGKGSRSRHMLRVHSKPGQFVCKTCNEQFDLEENLVIHRRRFHSNRSIPHPVYCEICGKQYKSETTLKIHRFIHLDEKLFQCDTCGASFKQSITLKNHKRVHSSVDKYSCKNCEKTFRWKQTFDKHVKKCLIYTNDKI
uniref:C2H2-type domain-containing protein n=1 Tax=Homalodisca liturata TaxID=320908 RepID=A0A1B6K7H6_9HEMI